MITLIEQRNQLLQESGNLVAGKTIDKETRAKFDLMIKDVDLLNAKIELEQRSNIAGRPPRTQPGTDSLTPSEEERSKAAFHEWMRTGNVSAENRSIVRDAKETRTIGATVGTGAQATNISSSSVFIPVGMDPLIHSALVSSGNLSANVRSYVTADGSPIKVATDDDSQSGLTLISPEGTAVTELDPSLGGFMSYVSEFTTSLITVSESELEDSYFSVDAFIQQKFATRVYNGLNKAIQLGSGNVQSIVTGLATPASFTTANGITLASLQQLNGDLDNAYQGGAKYIMSQKTKSSLMSLVDLFNRPLLQADSTQTPFNSIFGKDIVISNSMDAVGAVGKIPVMYGSLEDAYTLRSIRSGLKITRLVERYAELGLVGFIGRARFGGYLTTQASSPSLIGLIQTA
jgi:HK97 family phage major capsid protein